MTGSKLMSDKQNNHDGRSHSEKKDKPSVSATASRRIQSNAIKNTGKEKSKAESSGRKESALRWIAR